jgi:hypothetical protein
MNFIILFMAMVLLFIVFIFTLIFAEKLDKLENKTKEQISEKPYNRIFYPTKCEKCKKVDEFVTKPNMRFCNSCHCDYMMLD